MFCCNFHLDSRRKIFFNMFNGSESKCSIYKNQVGAIWNVKHFAELSVARNKCAASLNVPADVFAKYKNRILPDDPLTRSYVKCIFEELGVFSEQEGFLVERITSQFGFGSDSDGLLRLKNCAEKTDADTTNDIWAYRAFKCFIKEHSSEFYTNLDQKD